MVCKSSCAAFLRSVLALASEQVRAGAQALRGGLCKRAKLEREMRAKGQFYFTLYLYVFFKHFSLLANTAVAIFSFQ
jgi:hypothetical protein